MLRPYHGQQVTFTILQATFGPRPVLPGGAENQRAHHSTTPNARLDRNPELPSLRRHFSGGPQQALPPVPVLRARRRIGRGEEITWTYPPEFIKRLQSVGAW